MSLIGPCMETGFVGSGVLFAVNPVTISEQSECRVSCYFHSDITGVALLHYFLCNTIGYILITFSTSSSSMSLCSLLSGYKSNNKHAINVCSRIDGVVVGLWGNLLGRDTRYYLHHPTTGGRRDVESIPSRGHY